MSKTMTLRLDDEFYEILETSSADAGRSIGGTGKLGLEAIAVALTLRQLAHPAVDRAMDASTLAALRQRYLEDFKTRMRELLPGPVSPDAALALLIDPDRPDLST